MNRGQNSNEQTPDAELAHAARRGDKRAFVEIVARHQAMVCGIAFGILGDFPASEDAAQEAFLTAWRKIHELREAERLRGWLGQIARNAALGYLRRKRGEAPLEDASTLSDKSPAPDEAAANEEEAALVRDSLAKLPETYRLPLILFYRDGQSVRGVADALGITEDAVKQRLARGREMLRDRMSGLVETVLTRTGPTAVFTMTVAAAIGALAAPAAIAAGVFSAATSSVASTSTFVTAMSTSKTVLATAAVVTAICIPVGYYVTSDSTLAERTLTQTATNALASHGLREPSFENSALFAEWVQLHDTYGRTAEAMPAIYKAIADMKDPFRRRAFRAALISEWVQLDAKAGFAFFLDRRSDSQQRRQFFEEWLAHDTATAVNTLLKSGPGWEGMARDCLQEIARRAPNHVAAVAQRLPETDNYWDTKVRDAFAIVADGNLVSARAAAEAMTGPNRDQALMGVAQAWARSDSKGAIAWARNLPDGTDRDEVIRGALLGRAAIDPVGALDLVGLVPPGGRESYFATTTGARVLSEAAKVDFDAAVAWLAAHPGRLGREDLMGLAQSVADRINADPLGFLNAHAENGWLTAILPAIDSALMNDAAGQKAVIWEWLKAQPNNEISKHLKERILGSAAWQDPKLALKLVDDVPRTPEGERQIENLARSLFNGGNMLHRFDSLMEQAPERLRGALVQAAFDAVAYSQFHDPQYWIDRLSLLPEEKQPRGVESIARAWAVQAPEEAIEWVAAFQPGDARNSALATLTSTWAAKDPHGAAEWVATMSPGPERDNSAKSLVYAIAQKHPREAWTWALSLSDAAERDRAALHSASFLAKRDPATVRQWAEAAPLSPVANQQLQNLLYNK